jgi:O-succinylbenzoate synthase
MSRQITIKPYQRAFRRPLRTARGEWALREGFLVKVEQGGRVGYGEVAPLPEFGSETLSQAADFLRQLIRQADLVVPTTLPCCAFGLSAALQGKHLPRDYEVSALLPAGSSALRQASDKVTAGYRSLKWKIGVLPIAKEITAARCLIESLPADVSVRFDANASLTAAELEQWLDLLTQFPEQIDYIEQPLACGEEAAMARYMKDTGVPIALDESLNGVCGQRWLELGAWAGPLVVKAPLMGDVAKLAAKLEPVAEQVVLSSVFETGIGLENSLSLVDALPQIIRPIGFDTVGAFEDELNHIQSSPEICADARNAYDPDQIWNLI